MSTASGYHPPDFFVAGRLVGRRAPSVAGEVAYCRDQVCDLQKIFSAQPVSFIDAPVTVALPA
ncbi:hypothetical protein Sa4125_12970 [Aureimonas sp. SA4125]|nr:hypothetical protein Sa4125_12970 [Aureimonas sp. SA4125]